MLNTFPFSRNIRSTQWIYDSTGAHCSPSTCQWKRDFIHIDECNLHIWWNSVQRRSTPSFLSPSFRLARLWPLHGTAKAKRTTKTALNLLHLFIFEYVYSYIGNKPCGFCVVSIGVWLVFMNKGDIWRKHRARITCTLVSREFFIFFSLSLLTLFPPAPLCRPPYPHSLVIQ